MKKIVQFIGLGLAFNSAPEVLNQIYKNRSVSGFFTTIAVYAVYLFLIYFFRRIYVRIFKNQSAFRAVAWYVIFGIIGICIEWGLLGNAAVAWYGQIAMFTFWGSFGLIPVIFLEEPVFPDVRKKIKRYAFLWIPLFVICGAVNTDFGFLIWIFGADILNILYIRYFTLLARS